MPYKDKDIARIKALERVRLYQARHPDRVKEQRKAYKARNKEKIDAYMEQYYPKYHELVRRQPYRCECGCVITTRQKPAHLRTALHQRYLLKDDKPIVWF